MDYHVLLNSLIGKWSGAGQGTYPTIKPFDYVETLQFTRYDGSLIHYEQKTQRRGDRTLDLIPSHWEAGFIHVLESGEIQINNTQNGGRTEVLTGSLEETEYGFRLSLQSSSFLNDPRMLETSRVITVEGDTLRYTMHMRTRTVPDMEIHLEAELLHTSRK